MTPLPLIPPRTPQPHASPDNQMDQTLIPIVLISIPILGLGLLMLISWICLPRRPRSEPIENAPPRTSFRSSWGNLEILPPLPTHTEHAIELRTMSPESTKAEIV